MTAQQSKIAPLFAPLQIFAPQLTKIAHRGAIRPSLGNPVLKVRPKTSYCTNQKINNTNKTHFKINVVNWLKGYEVSWKMIKKIQSTKQILKLINNITKNCCKNKIIKDMIVSFITWFPFAMKQKICFKLVLFIQETK